MNSSKLQSKIALGTVQFGLNYGINNRLGKPSREVVFEILDAAIESNITLLDTADAYGNSIQVIGEYFRQRKNHRPDIVSKFVNDGGSLAEKAIANLTALGIPSLYGYMFHRFADYGVPVVKDQLLRLKEEGKVKYIGVSVYDSEELEQVISDPDIQIIQIPANPFDFSARKRNLMTLAKANGKEIHVRSVFLQGLFFRSPDSLTGNLVGLKAALIAFHKIVDKHGLDTRQACLNYVLHSNLIDKAIIGVDSKEQLLQNMDSILSKVPQELAADLESIQIADPALLNPSRWIP